MLRYFIARKKDKGHHVNKPVATNKEENANVSIERTDINGATNEPSEAVQGNSPGIERDPERKAQIPRHIIEKGIIYFFIRSRVNVENPQGVQDLQRTYFILRPLSKDAKLGHGPIPESNKNRLAVLPKKVFPKSSKDRFLAFVEKGGVSMKTLKEEFFPGTEYETKTAGTRQTPPVVPLGEGVYVITAMGRTSYLTYILTIPREIGQVQSDIGLQEKDSFIIGVKNPTKKGPTYAQLPRGPEYPKEMLEEFHDLRWIPVHKAEYLNYANAQFLLIGKGGDRLNKALEPNNKDKEDGKETAEEELKKLEGEDLIRVEQMDGDAAIFEDLHIDKRNYPDVLTTW
jgi:uroporphyrinogen-III synthase